MPLLPVYDWLGIDVTDRQKWIVNATAVVVAVFVLIDWGVVHPRIWMNDPSVLYWLAKPVVVGGTMIGVLWIARKRGVGRVPALLAAAFVGVFYLQVYYTVVPVPLEDGGAVQIGFVGNLTEGFIVHFGAAAIAVLVAAGVYRYVVPRYSVG